MPADPPGVKTRARIEKVGARYRATLEIETTRSRGERVLEADTCEALARSSAVVVAMAVAPDRERAADEAKPEPPAAAPAPARPAEEAKPAERDGVPKKEGDSSPSVALRAEGVADTAMLPSLGVGGGVGLGVHATTRLRFEAHASLFAEQEGRVDGDRGARFSLFTAGARACWSITRDVEIAPCAGLAIGAVGATGFGAQRVGDGTAVVVAPEVLLAFRVPVAGPLALAAGAGVLAPLSRESFVITGRGTVHEIPAVTFRGFLGPEVRF